MKAAFWVKIQYFRPSGKWYTEAHAWMSATDCGSRLISDPGAGRSGRRPRRSGVGYPETEGCTSPRVAYMHDITDKIREWNEEGKLPGLSSGGWTGPILVTCDEGVPCLIMPRSRNDLRS